jgi:hypothetical protein
MEINNQVLEYKYVYYINQLEIAKVHKNVLDILWVGKFKRRLKKRLNRLESDYAKKLISEKAYRIWQSMIKNAIKN